MGVITMTTILHSNVKPSSLAAKGKCHPINNLPYRMVKNKKTVPQTTKNSHRKNLIDYGQSKSQKLKSRRNSKK